MKSVQEPEQVTLLYEKTKFICMNNYEQEQILVFKIQSVYISIFMKNVVIDNYKTSNIQEIPCHKKVCYIWVQDTITQVSSSWLAYSKCMNLYRLSCMYSHGSCSRFLPYDPKAGIILHIIINTVNFI